MIIEYKKSYAQQIAESTEKYIQNHEEPYAERVSAEIMKAMLLSIGYRLKFAFNYDNTLNNHIPHYKAKSFSVDDIKTGQSAYHYEQKMSNHENLRKLQQIRQDFFVFEKGRIWEF